ncbi:ASCH domain-containing protein [Parachlamydia acanthamoebae]|jgi:ASC-1-like (ASCH) protein|uniref:ASCH domain-containing protein n=1 Tax=Parachlamydia acanthamoebae (strain UV7) TaxID=765952 RepID=F8KWH1_PARAV|nr:ASCH domain-containing protein [Parachlamydia acanthamoebae]EFB42393.1 hypothetical protein pah_c009o037 [Parachlamydia acanthamoebae str. Hall's coccus]CCB85369.1 putative uncharacterized protein [Parachlamydia acanthamoebae UV-7]
MLDINVEDQFFKLIKQGKKTVEGRLAKSKFLNLAPGDCLRINNQLIVFVQRVDCYPFFRDMLFHEGLKNVLPGCASLDEGENIYYRFYSREDEKKFGVIAVKLKLE